MRALCRGCCHAASTSALLTGFVIFGLLDEQEGTWSTPSDGEGGLSFSSRFLCRKLHLVTCVQQKPSLRPHVSTHKIHMPVTFVWF